MKTKAKRVRAVAGKQYHDAKNKSFVSERGFFIKQADVPALIEQLHRDYWSLDACVSQTPSCMAYALKRVGITAGRVAK